MERTWSGSGLLARGRVGVSFRIGGKLRRVEVSVVPCLQDNYAYLLFRQGSPVAAVVDPGEAAPVASRLKELGLGLGAILCTHHHADHVGGNEALMAEMGRVEVYGSEADRGRIPGQTRFLSHEERTEVLGITFRVLHIPGHTLGAIAYVGEGVVFTGDTLFTAGCGRLFEGTPAQMYESLNVKLGALPDDTLVYSGHEYTANNLRFAAHLEPSNRAISQKAERVRDLRERGVPTMPSTIGEERETNPFMRCDSPEIRAHFADKLGEGASPSDVLGAIRAAKDAF
jgi:hydroxyacylglutathione hydrolase